MANNLLNNERAAKTHYMAISFSVIFASVEPIMVFERSAVITRTKLKQLTGYKTIRIEQFFREMFFHLLPLLPFNFFYQLFQLETMRNSSTVSAYVAAI